MVTILMTWFPVCLFQELVFENQELRRFSMDEDGTLRIEKVQKLAPIAEEIGCTMAQLALAWCLKNPNVSTVITGASKPEQVIENMEALALEEQLTADVMERIESVLDNAPQPEPNWRRF